MGCSSALEEPNYGLLKDLRVELKVSDEGSFCLCFWLYLTKAGPFPATILHQEDADTGTSAPFLAVNETREMMLFPVPYLHKEALGIANSSSPLEVPCLSISTDFPLERWVHVGCQASPSFVRLHINGVIVGEKYLPPVHSDEAQADVGKRRFLPCIIGNKHGFQGYVYCAEFSPSTIAVKPLYLKNPPLQLSIDKSSACDIDDEIDGVWNIVGGKASCRKKFSLDVLLLDAFGQPVKKEVEVFASLLYAENNVPVQLTSNGEAPLLTSVDGIECACADTPNILVDGRASFKLKISQLSSKCENKLFHIRFQVPKLGRYPFLEAYSLPIRCISRSRNTRTTWRNLTPGVHFCNGSQPPRLDGGSSEILHNVVREAKSSPSSKRVKLGNNNPVYSLNNSLTSKRADQGCISETYITKKVGNADGSRLRRHENHDRSDNFSSDSENSETTKSDLRFTPPRTIELSDELVFKYCLAGSTERILLLKEIAMSVREEELSNFAEQVSLFSGCSHHLQQIKIAKRLTEEGTEAWNLISVSSNLVPWENVVTWMNEYFKKITCVDRSLTQQDMELLRRISGSQGTVSQEIFEKMWFWMYPVAFTLSQYWINSLWSSVSPKWIEGFFTKEEAESSLHRPGGLQDVGTFLLRFPTSRSWPHPDAGSLVITYVGSDYAIHHRLLSLKYICSSKSGKGLQYMLLNEPELSRLGRLRRFQ